MTYPNLFTKEETDKVIERINRLTAHTTPQWGKMSVGQMLAHCSVPYEYEFDPKKYGEPAKGVKRFIMRMFLKSIIAGPKPYARNSRTAPDFLMTTEKEFETEKSRLIEYLKKTQELGADHFENKVTHSIGTLTADEWNTMFYKHLDHHLTQFGV